jgi:hypothetical protein
MLGYLFAGSAATSKIVFQACPEVSRLTDETNI